MSRFTQLHVLTFYPPSNLNRDDMGRPKTARVGGSPRLRISSQCLKRTWRTSEVMAEAVAGNLGTRTKQMGSQWILPILDKAGIKEKDARAWAAEISACFGKVKKDAVDTEQLVHFGPEEQRAVTALAERLAAEKRAPQKEELSLLRAKPAAVDIAMFGRMLANNPDLNVNAAVQVSHAFSVNKVDVEDDFFTAVDDLNRQGDTGAGHLDENAFGSGVFYLYICINRELLEANLNSDRNLAQKALHGLTRAVALTSPSGKQNSFAAWARAGFVLAEHGNQQPRSLALAFMKAIRHDDLLAEAVEQLRLTRHNLDASYGAGSEHMQEFYPARGEGNLQELLRFVAEG